MSKRKDYPDGTKAACMAALLSGQMPSEVAATYSVPEGTLKSWRSRMRNGESVATVAPERKDEIGELLVSYLNENLRTLRAQLVVFGDATWLKQQEAGQVAVLHGVMTDKAIRLMEAMSGAGLSPG